MPGSVDRRLRRSACSGPNCSRSTSDSFPSQGPVGVCSICWGHINSDTIAVIIEHSGRYSEKQRDGMIVHAVLKPRSGVAQSKTEPLQSTGSVGGGTPEDLSVGFWRKGVAVGWHLYIEPEELARNVVDLTGSEVSQCKGRPCSSVGLAAVWRRGQGTSVSP
jgi:hypothetical protein